MPNVTASTFTLLGGQFQIGDSTDGASVNYTTVNQVDSCDFSGSKVDVEDVTSADNTDGYKRKQDRLADAGQCQAEILWNPNDATHQQLWNAYISRGRRDFKRINAGGLGTRAFTGIITSMDEKQTIDKATKMTVKIDISGPITETIAGA